MRSHGDCIRKNSTHCQSVVWWSTRMEVMIHLMIQKRNEDIMKYSYTSEMYVRINPIQFFDTSIHEKLTEICNWIQNDIKNYGKILTKVSKKIIHSWRLGRKDEDMKRIGNTWILKDPSTQWSEEEYISRQFVGFTKSKGKLKKLITRFILKFFLARTFDKRKTVIPVIRKSWYVTNDLSIDWHDDPLRNHLLNHLEFILSKYLTIINRLEDV